MLRDRLESSFPRLKGTTYAVQDNPTTTYNCIGWAAGDTTRWWWPNKYGYWPSGIARKVTVESFEAVFGTLGYQRCDNGGRVEGVEKIAIYTKNGVPTHAARQMENGTWTSKMGQGVLISHELDWLIGTAYGSPAFYMARSRVKPQPERP